MDSPVAGAGGAKLRRPPGGVFFTMVPVDCAVDVPLPGLGTYRLAIYELVCIL